MQSNQEQKNAAECFGYRIEQGEGTLAGKFWWTLCLAGLDVEVSPLEFDSDNEAWDDAIRAHQDELAEIETIMAEN